MKSIFEINFIRTEFELNGLRIDSLGFDKSTNAFVIEYKRDRNFSVIDQGFAYLSLLLNWDIDNRTFVDHTKITTKVNGRSTQNQ